MAIERWTKEQTIVALNLYCKIPFNKVSSKHPEIIRIANIIGRSPNSVKMKIGNFGSFGSFGSFDPELKKKGIVGLGNSSKLDSIVWNEFNQDWEKLAYESELLISKFLNEPIEHLAQINIDDIPLGKERESVIRTRINQKFFRSTILSSYNFKCCITGLSVSELLVASHIIPWSKDIKNRLNPHNGLCLNSIHDQAFDKGLITIKTDYKLKISKFLSENKKDNAIYDFFMRYDNQQILLPDPWAG